MDRDVRLSDMKNTATIRMRTGRPSPPARASVVSVAAGLCVAALWVGRAIASPMPRQAPLLVAGGRYEPLICVYWFGHEWEPWRGSDRAAAEALEQIASLKINTLLVNHQPSQSLDRNWKWLDRDHRLAKAAGLQILPFLERGAGADMAAHASEVGQRLGLVVPLGLTQLGERRGALIWRQEAQSALASYARIYLQRYLDQGAILRVAWHGRPRPVISLSAETGWEGVSFDPETTALFRGWLERKYGSIARLNAAWGTKYASFSDVNPRDAVVFRYDDAGGATRPPVEDHARFRAELVSRSLGKVADRLRAQYPDLLFCAEVPYSFACPRRAASAFRWSAAMLPEIVEYADIVVIRSAGKLWESDWPALQALSASGKQLVLAHRVGRPGSLRRARPGPMVPAVYADTCIPAEAAVFANGIGWYSWNDMRGPHLVGHRDASKLFSLVETANRSYRRMVGGDSEHVNFRSAWEMTGPTNADIINFGGSPETKVLPHWVARNVLADGKVGRDETGTYREGQPPRRGGAWSQKFGEVVFDNVRPGLDVLIQLRVGSRKGGRVGIRFLDSAGTKTLWSETASCGRRVAYVEWRLPLSTMEGEKGRLQLAPIEGIVRVYDMRLWMEPASAMGPTVRSP
ncbi:MAG: beta-galactosidase [Armatimonadota bacterium]